VSKAVKLAKREFERR